MYVGGLGKEWTSIEGVVENLNPQWVKSIGPGGDVRHEDWHVYYNNMKKAADIQFPGRCFHRHQYLKYMYIKFALSNCYVLKGTFGNKMRCN